MKKKLLFFAIIISSFSGYSQAPSFQWAHAIGNISTDQAFGVKTDNAGNVVTTGQFSSLVDFDSGPGTFTIMSNGTVDVFLKKLDSFGNFLWAKAWGGTGVDNGTDIVLDNSGNIFITGYFEGTVDFDPGVGIYNLTSNGQADVYIIKLDPSGNFIWAKSVGANLIDRAFSIKVDPSGNSFCVGSFQGIVDFDPGAGTYTLTSQGGFDSFILKLDNNGNFVWARSVGGSQTDYGQYLSIDNAGNNYIIGSYMDLVDFDPGIGINLVNSSGQFDNDTYVLKLDVNGNFLWVKTINGVGSDYGRVITTNSSGEIFCAGIYSGTRDFDPGAGTFTMTSNGFDDMFVLKLNSSGNFVWASSFGGANSEWVNSINLSSTGQLYLTGTFSGVSDFDPGPTSYTLSSVTPFSLDAYILNLSSTGSLIWAGSVGSNGDDYGTALALDPLNNIHLVGSVSGIGDFDPGIGTYTIGANLNTQQFNLKLSYCVQPSAPLNVTPINNQTICANNTTTLMASSTGTINWYSSPTSTVTLGTGTNYVTPTLTAGSYTYYAETKTCGPSATRTAITLLVSPCTGISNLTSINTSIKIYPNPSTGIFHLSNPGGEKLEIKILNALGQQVLNKVIYENENLIDISNFSNGVYFVRIKNHSDETNTIKLVKE